LARHQDPHEGRQPGGRAQQRARQPGDQQLRPEAWSIDADSGGCRGRARGRARRRARRAAGSGATREIRCRRRRRTCRQDFGDSAILYRTRFWIADFSKDDLAQDAVRNDYYEFRRRNIEIRGRSRFSDRVEPPADTPERRDRFAVAQCPVFARLPEEAHRALAADARAL
jgi:hypothetical protein